MTFNSYTNPPITDVTFIISSYNQCTSLALTLHSLLHQYPITIPPTSTIIISDDGSTDGTELFIEDLSRTVPNPFIFLTKTHDGYGKSQMLNLSLSQVTTEYVVQMDADLLASSVAWALLSLQSHILDQGNYTTSSGRFIRLTDKLSNKVLSLLPKLNIPISRTHKTPVSFTRIAKLLDLPVDSPVYETREGRSFLKGTDLKAYPNTLNSMTLFKTAWLRSAGPWPDKNTYDPNLFDLRGEDRFMQYALARNNHYLQYHEAPPYLHLHHPKTPEDSRKQKDLLSTVFPESQERSWRHNCINYKKTKHLSHSYIELLSEVFANVEL